MSINVPSAAPTKDATLEVDSKMQTLINFAHTRWGVNNWIWSLTHQDLDFVELSNGSYSAGVAAFVTITVKTLDLKIQNVGYATCLAGTKGAAIFKARMASVTNALRNTLLGFGGSIATDLKELLDPPQTQEHENNQNLANKSEPKNVIANKSVRREPETNGSSCMNSSNMNSTGVRPAPLKNPPLGPPTAKALPMPVPAPAGLPPPANRAPLPRSPAPRPSHTAPNTNGNEPPPAATTAPPGEAAKELEAARAERKRRQRQAQEEFRLKQLMRNQDPAGAGPTPTSNPSGFDSLLLEIPSQAMEDIVIEQTADAEPEAEETGKRKSPSHSNSASKKRVMNRLDIVTD